MPSYHFYQIDVFTNQAFGGNPLAVIPDATGLSAEDMLRIAREMNLSETTFVFPPTTPDADFKVRIFMTHGELPFAGHPIVGTHWLLAHLGRVKLQAPSVKVTFELGVGLRSACLNVTDGKVTSVMTDHQQPIFGAPANSEQVARLARALQLPVEAITDTGFPVMWVSTGLRQLFVPVRSLAEVQGINSSKVNAGILDPVCTELDPLENANFEVMVLCTQTEYPTSNVHTRMFAPGIGLLEDPATGSASGGLGAYLIHNRVLPTTAPTTRIISEQGIEMGRPSFITIEVDGTPENIQMVRVGGTVIPLIEGDISW